MLRAIQEVFQKEQDVLMSAFHSQLSSLGKYDANALLNQMQHRLQEQVTYRNTAKMLNL